MNAAWVVLTGLRLFSRIPDETFDLRESRERTEKRPRLFAAG